MKRLNDTQILEIWSATDADGMAMPCLGERLPEGMDRNTLIEPPPLPFGLLPDAIRVPAFLWIIENVTAAAAGGHAVFITARELAGLLEADTAITLTETQMREALLHLGMEPWDTGGDWSYRVHADCPCAALAGETLHVAER